MTIVFCYITQVFEPQQMAVFQYKPTNSIHLTKNNMLAFVGVSILSAIVVYHYMEYRKSEEL
jgi:hypothetical protein